MYSNQKAIALGGSSTVGKFAFYLSSDLYRGSSSYTDTYNNDMLSKNADFKCYKLEVWAIIDWVELLTQYTVREYYFVVVISKIKIHKWKN